MFPFLSFSLCLVFYLRASYFLATSLIHLKFYIKIVFNREHLVFIMDDVDGNSIGFYLNAKIHQYKYQENGRWKGGRIADPNAFIFILENKTLSSITTDKFMITNECQEMAFRLYKKEFHLLFSIGASDFSIPKRQMRDKCCHQQHSFDYHGSQLFKDQQFEVRRIQVLQMK